ncbi:hypothetical protein [Brucella intermedia]|uniref:hypothetical protein n=1 Tax=Brucella intermedia TaxID=94625 RepID=UPI00124D6F71|nr:hypothetical protein [Brucella intermedia]KAB2670785.1 hypothetical protein F9K77_12430 [Ochrobactrum sp. LMG 5442]KAB2716919.1 hypothetical protein F9K75_12655 [Brucella intermedia]
MAKLTWGDILVASFSACLACGPDEPVDKRTLSTDLEKYCSFQVEREKAAPHCGKGSEDVTFLYVN